MKIYEKPMAIINKFEVADVIAASTPSDEIAQTYVDANVAGQLDGQTQGVVFAW